MKLFQILKFAPLALFPLSASAYITDMWGDIEFDTTPGSYESSDVMLAFDEKQHVTLQKHLKVDWEVNPAYDGRHDNKIAKGTSVSSHYFYLKTDGFFSSESAEAYVEFDGPILGVILSKNKLNKSDDKVGLHNIDYPNGWLSGSSSWTGDALYVDDSGHGATLKMNVHRLFGVGGYDSMRVITYSKGKNTPIPEASSLAYLGGFLGLVGFSVWRRRNRAATTA
ncbi:MAG: hypothetical protein ACFB20_05410 [Opitutales bacterium]